MLRNSLQLDEPSPSASPLASPVRGAAERDTCLLRSSSGGCASRARACAAPLQNGLRNPQTDRRGDGSRAPRRLRRRAHRRRMRHA
jgi:hypothetical protein